MNVHTAIPSFPEASEYAPYYGKYIALVPDRNVVETLEAQMNETVALLSSLTEAQATHRYAPGKWTLKQVLGHVSDSERIFAYRILRISRGDQTPIEGFEQDDYVRTGPFDRMPLAALIDEFQAVRRATVALIRPLDRDAWTRRGIANKNEISVRALAYIIAGHELHHRNILRSHYLA
jgi:uncharacterized damage-inducible protein DinB